MIVRVGKRNVELVAHESDPALFVGTSGDFKIDLYQSLGRFEALVSMVADEDGGVITRATSRDPEWAVARALIDTAQVAKEEAYRARREHEQLDVHALRVAVRMRETAEIAERARRLVECD